MSSIDQYDGAETGPDAILQVHLETADRLITETRRALSSPAARPTYATPDEELQAHFATLSVLAEAGNHEAAVLWAQIYEPHPDDGLTIEGIRRTVERLLCDVPLPGPKQAENTDPLPMPIQRVA